MIWLTWRQFRAQAITAAAALAAFAILLAVTEPQHGQPVRRQRDHRLPRRHLRGAGHPLP